MERMALFPGCLVLQRMPRYEKAAKRVLGELGLHLEGMPRAACCGAPLESFSDDWVYLAAYNLSLADRMGLDIVTLCGNCASALLRARAALADAFIRRQANDRLNEIGLHVDGRSTVRHLVQVLSGRLEALRERIQTSLSVKVALTHPCQAFRPSEIVCFDDPLKPQAMRRIVELTGAELLNYEGEYDCCGSSLYLADEELALEAGRRKLLSAAEADVLVDACGNCQLLLERFQVRIGRPTGAQRRPVLALPQLLGLAMAIDPAELGIAPVMVRELVQCSA